MRSNLSYLLKSYLLYFYYVDEMTYSRVQKSIENWSVWSKMALGEVGVLLPYFQYFLHSTVSFISMPICVPNLSS